MGWYIQQALRTVSLLLCGWFSASLPVSLQLAPLDHAEFGFGFFCHGTGLEVRFVQSSQHHTGSSVRHMYTFPDKQTAVIASSTDNMSITTGKSNIRHMGRMT